MPLRATLIQRPVAARGWPPARPRTRPRSRTSGPAARRSSASGSYPGLAMPRAPSRPCWPRWRSWPRRPRPRPRRRPADGHAARSRGSTSDYRNDGKIEVCTHERVRSPARPRHDRAGLRHRLSRTSARRWRPASSATTTAAARRRADATPTATATASPEATGTPTSGDTPRRTTTRGTDDAGAIPPDDGTLPPEDGTARRRAPSRPPGHAAPPPRPPPPSPRPRARRRRSSRAPNSDGLLSRDPARARPAGRGGAGRVPLAARRTPRRRRLAGVPLPHPHDVDGLHRLVPLGR